MVERDTNGKLKTPAGTRFQWWRFQWWRFNGGGSNGGNKSPPGQRLKLLSSKQLKCSSIGDRLHEVRSVSTKRSPNNEQTA